VLQIHRKQDYLNKIQDFSDGLKILCLDRNWPLMPRTCREEEEENKILVNPQLMNMFSET
jgi:hypothetical protein